jgi:hypothetical protein
MKISIRCPSTSHPVCPHLETWVKAAGPRHDVGLLRETAGPAGLGEVYDRLTEKERKSAVRRGTPISWDLLTSCDAAVRQSPQDLLRSAGA